MKSKRGRGRPKLTLTKEQEYGVEFILGLGGTYKSAAEFCGCSKSGLEKNYMGLLKKGKDRFNTRLRIKLGTLAVVRGVPSICIFLAKNNLGMTDKMRVDDGNPEHMSGFQIVPKN